MGVARARERGDGEETRRRRLVISRCLERRRRRRRLRRRGEWRTRAVAVEPVRVSARADADATGSDAVEGAVEVRGMTPRMASGGSGATGRSAQGSRPPRQGHARTASRMSSGGAMGPVVGRGTGTAWGPRAAEAETETETKRARARRRGGKAASPVEGREDLVGRAVALLHFPRLPQQRAIVADSLGPGGRSADFNLLSRSMRQAS